MKKAENASVRIIPLGGLEQIGMNITAIEYDDSIVVVDCGLSFPEEDMLGIDLVIPYWCNSICFKGCQCSYIRY